MDLSDEAFPIFESNFFFFKPYRWFKEIITADISEILLAQDSGMDLKERKEHIEQKRWNSISGIFDERVILAFEGKLHVKEVSRDEIWPEEEPEAEIQHNTLEITVTVSGILLSQ